MDDAPMDSTTIKESTALGRPFAKGQSGNPLGKKPGTPNRVTLEIREAAREIVDDPEYRARLKARALDGKLAPAIEALLFHYGYGVPKQTFDINQPTKDVRKMDTEELKTELADLLSKL